MVTTPVHLPPVHIEPSFRLDENTTAEHVGDTLLIRHYDTVICRIRVTTPEAARDLLTEAARLEAHVHEEARYGDR